MLVVALSDCPIGLRGDLTKWLVEIQAGIFVGTVSARVREKLWQRIQNMCKKGRAVMVFGTNNEQKLDFRTLGDTWEPIDFDGIKLLLRPSPSRLKRSSSLRPGFSNAASHMVRRRVTESYRLPKNYAVIDIKTTGLDANNDQIRQISALKVEQGQILGSFCVFMDSNDASEGSAGKIKHDEVVSRRENIQKFLAFVGAFPVVSHNVGFDYAFLRSACAQCNLSLFNNRCIDTLALSKRLIQGVKNYRLNTLAEHFGFETHNGISGGSDCVETHKLYENLRNLHESKM